MSLVILADDCGQMTPFDPQIEALAASARLTTQVLHLQLTFSTDGAEFRDASGEGRTLADLDPGEPVLAILVSDGIHEAFVDGRLHQALMALPEGTSVIWMHPWEPCNWPDTRGVYGLYIAKPKPLQRGLPVDVALIEFDPNPDLSALSAGIYPRVSGRGRRVESPADADTTLDQWHAPLWPESSGTDNRS
jgi:hypothetical protein